MSDGNQRHITKAMDSLYDLMTDFILLGRTESRMKLLAERGDSGIRRIVLEALEFLEKTAKDNDNAVEDSLTVNQLQALTELQNHIQQEPLDHDRIGRAIHDFLDMGEVVYTRT